MVLVFFCFFYSGVSGNREAAFKGLKPDGLPVNYPFSFERRGCGALTTPLPNVYRLRPPSLLHTRHLCCRVDLGWVWLPKFTGLGLWLLVLPPPPSRGMVASVDPAGLFVIRADPTASLRSSHWRFERLGNGWKSRTSRAESPSFYFFRIKNKLIR